MSADFIFIFSGNRFQRINLSALLYITTTNDRCMVVTKEGRYPTSINLTRFENILPAMNFCRVNERCLVALHQIISFDRHSIKLPGTSFVLEKKWLSELKSRVKIITGIADHFFKTPLVVDANGKLSHV